jgi:uncharacterized protein HemX
MPQKPKKRLDKLSYGALALYIALLGALGLGVYGVNFTSLLVDKNRSERERSAVQNGRMVIVSSDRSQCRSLRFDNDTAELGRETLMDCDAAKVEAESGSYFNTIRDGFNNKR